MALLGLGLAHAPLAAQERLTDGPKLELALALGVENVKSGPLAKFQEKLIQLLQRGIPADSFDDEFSRFVADQSEECLPLQVQVFGARNHDGEGDRAFLVIVDSAAPLNLQNLVTSKNTKALEGLENAWFNNGTAFRQLGAAGQRSRLLAGNVFGDRPQESPLFHGRQLPEPGRVHASLLAKLRKAPYHLMVDVSVLSDNPAAARQLTALVGPHGTLLGATMQVSGGRPAVDLIWGLQPGRGVLGMFLPTRPADAKILGSLPFEPSFLMLGNLGRQGRQGLITACRAALAGGGNGTEEAAVKEMLDLLDCWGGEFQFMSRLPDPPAVPLTAIRPRNRHKSQDPLFSVVFKVEEESEAEAVKVLKRLIPTMAGVSPRFMPFQEHNGVHATALGRGRLAIQGADGLVIVVLGRTDDDCMDVIRGVRERYPVHTMPAKVDGTRAPLKIFVNQNNIARIAQQPPRVPPHIAARGRKQAEAYRFGYRLTTELARHLLTDHLLYSLSWNRACVRMRLQF